MNAPVIPEQSGIRRKRALPVQGSASSLARHPRDGWTRARPFPLGRRGRRIFRAVMRAVCPPAPAPHGPELERRVELGVRRFMAYMPRISARGLLVLFIFLSWAPRLMLVSFAKLEQLDRTVAARVICRLAHSRFALLRHLMAGIRGMILSAYFDQEEVHRAMGYTPVPFMKSRIRLRERMLAVRQLEAS